MVMIFSWIISPGKTGQPGSAGIIFREENGFLYIRLSGAVYPCRKREVIHILQIVSLEEGKFKEGKWGKRDVC